MLALDEQSVTLASTFVLGFSVGVLTTLRLFGITFNMAHRVIRRHDKQTIDENRADGVDKSEKGNPP